MNDDGSVGEALLSALQAMSGWEVLAVLLGIAYIWLAAREHIACWYAAFFSTSIYIFLFWDAKLLMESALQVYYVAMAVYGWWQWHHHKNPKDDLLIHTWRPFTHLWVITATLVVSGLSGYLLEQHTDAALPYLDSFTTWASVVTTVMVARKVLENWLYWIVIDSAAIYLYIDRGFYLTALLFAAYVVIVVFGYIEWRKHWLQQRTA